MKDLTPEQIKARPLMARWYQGKVNWDEERDLVALRLVRYAGSYRYRHAQATAAGMRLMDMAPGGVS